MLAKDFPEDIPAVEAPGPGTIAGAINGRAFTEKCQTSDALTSRLLGMSILETGASEMPRSSTIYGGARAANRDNDPKGSADSDSSLRSSHGGDAGGSSGRGKDRDSKSGQYINTQRTKLGESRYTRDVDCVSTTTPGDRYEHQLQRRQRKRQQTHTAFVAPACGSSSKVSANPAPFKNESDVSTGGITWPGARGVGVDSTGNFGSTSYKTEPRKVGAAFDFGPTRFDDFYPQRDEEATSEGMCTGADGGGKHPQKTRGGKRLLGVWFGRGRRGSAAHPHEDNTREGGRAGEGRDERAKLLSRIDGEIADEENFQGAEGVGKEEEEEDMFGTSNGDDRIFLWRTLPEVDREQTSAELLNSSDQELTTARTSVSSTTGVHDVPSRGTSVFRTSSVNKKQCKKQSASSPRASQWVRCVATRLRQPFGRTPGFFERAFRDDATQAACKRIPLREDERFPSTHHEGRNRLFGAEESAHSYRNGGDCKRDVGEFYSAVVGCSWWAVASATEHALKLRMHQALGVSARETLQDLTSRTEHVSGNKTGRESRAEFSASKTNIVLRQQQRLLVLLHHAESCSGVVTKFHTGGRGCDVPQHCPAVKMLWNHVAACDDAICPVRYFSSDKGTVVE